MLEQLLFIVALWIAYEERQVSIEAFEAEKGGHLMADKEVRQTVREAIIEMLEEQIQRQEAKLNEFGEVVNKKPVPV